MTTYNNRSRCVIDLLFFATSVSKALADALDLPPFDLVHMWMTYGIHLEHASSLLKKRSFHAIFSMTLREFVHFFIVPSAFPWYSERLARLRDMIVAGKINATLSSKAIIASLESAEECLVATALDHNGAQRKAKSFAALCGAKTSRAKKVGPETTVWEAIVSVAESLSIDAGLLRLAASLEAFLEIDAVAKKPVPPATLGAVRKFVDQVRRRALSAVANKPSRGSFKVFGPLVVVDDERAAEPFLEAADPYVLIVSEMRIRKGDKSGALDATEVLCQVSALLRMAAERLAANRGRSRKHLEQVVSTMIAIFESELPDGGEKAIELLAKMVGRKSSTETLARLGFFGGSVSEQQPQPQQEPPVQVVQVRNDPYTNVMLGLSTGAQCCSCCALWGVADAMDEY